MSQAIKDRFSDELKTVNDYTTYIENNFYSRSRSVVRTVGYEDFGTLNDYVLYANTQAEKDRNRQIIDSLKIIVDSKISDKRNKLMQMEEIELPSISENILQNDLAESLIGYIESTVYDCMENENNKPYHELITEITPVVLKAEVDEQDQMCEEQYYDMLTEDDYANILNYVRCKLYNEAITDFENELEDLEELKTLYNIFDEKNPINIYRQAFILSMTAFDATIFDLFAEIFNQDFFGVARIINYEKKFTLKDITQCQSFNDFASQTVDSMISGKYASDIVEILHQYKPQLFLVNGQDSYECILEMIQRRNVHVHKKGIVDEKYFSKGNGRQLGLNNGDYAAIDYLYYLNSYETLNGFIANFQ